MNIQQQFDRQGVALRQVEDADGTKLVADFGPTVESAVDIVGETVLVVVDDEQFEFELDTENAQAFITNGVLTIEVNG